MGPYAAQARNSAVPSTDAGCFRTKNQRSSAWASTQSAKSPQRRGSRALAARLSAVENAARSLGGATPSLNQTSRAAQGRAPAAKARAPRASRVRQKGGKGHVRLLVGGKGGKAGEGRDREPAEEPPARAEISRDRQRDDRQGQDAEDRGDRRGDDARL